MASGTCTTEDQPGIIEPRRAQIENAGSGCDRAYTEFFGVYANERLARLVAKFDLRNHFVSMSVHYIQYVSAAGFIYMYAQSPLFSTSV